MTPKTQNDKSYSLHPIGYVRSSDEQGSYSIQILPPYRDALEQLDQFSHVMIIWWADKHDNPEDRAVLTAQLPYARGVRAGVFACRSEYRPNPLAVTVMPILAIDREQGVLVLPWIDAFDGTPVLDLKAYMPVSDRVRDVKVAAWLQDWPVWMEDAGEYFAAHPTDFGG